MRIHPLFVGSLCLFLLGCLCSCAPVLEGNNQNNNQNQNGPPPTRTVAGDKVTTKDLGSGQTQVTVNASDDSAWVHFSFAKGYVKVDDPKTSADWDLGFQRYLIKSNSGVNGKGNVGVMFVEDNSFEEVTKAPKDGYLEDKEDSEDEGSDPDYGFLVEGAWFAYNVRDHTLTPRKRVYVVRSTTGKYYKVALEGYYDSNGNSGFPRFKWAEISPP